MRRPTILTSLSYVIFAGIQILCYLPDSLQYNYEDEPRLAYAYCQVAVMSFNMDEDMLYSC